MDSQLGLNFPFKKISLLRSEAKVILLRQGGGVNFVMCATTQHKTKLTMINPASIDSQAFE
jgi:hypothetical protein